MKLFELFDGNIKTEDRHDSPSGDRITTDINPLVTEYENGSMSGHLNLATMMNIYGISQKYQKTLADAVLKAGPGKQVKIPDEMLTHRAGEYRDSGIERQPPELTIELSKHHEADLAKGDARNKRREQAMGHQSMGSVDLDNQNKDLRDSVEEDEGQVGVTAEEVQAAWMEVFPNSSVAARKAFGGGTTFKFRLAKDESEVSSKIMDNDPLNYSALLDENGNWKEYSTSMFIAPEEGSYNVYSSAKFRKKSAKNVKLEQIKKRFAQVKEFVAANADKMIRLHFDIGEKLGVASESAPAQNPVAKHQRTFNKATVQRDRKKDAKRGKIKHKGRFEEGRFEDEGPDFYDGQRVELKPAYADNPGEVFTLSNWDGRRGWIGDADGRGWGVTGDQIISAEEDEWEDDNVYEETKDTKDATTAPDDMTRDPRITHILNKARVSYPGAPDDLSALVNMMGDEQTDQDNEIDDLDQYNGTQDVEIGHEERVNVDQEDEITDLRKRIERLEGGRAPDDTNEAIVPNDGDDEYPFIDDETGEVFPAGMSSSVSFDDDDEEEDEDPEFDAWLDRTGGKKGITPAKQAEAMSMFGDIAAGGGDPIDYLITNMGLDIDDIDAMAIDQGYNDANEWAESYQDHEMESIIRNSNKLNQR